MAKAKTNRRGRPPGTKNGQGKKTKKSPGQVLRAQLAPAQVVSFDPPTLAREIGRAPAVGSSVESLHEVCSVLLGQQTTLMHAFGTLHAQPSPDLAAAVMGQMMAAARKPPAENE
jgi:hypothetical protein